MNKETFTEYYNTEAIRELILSIGITALSASFTTLLADHHVESMLLSIISLYSMTVNLFFRIKTSKTKSQLQSLQDLPIPHIPVDHDRMGPLATWFHKNDEKNLIVKNW